MSLPYESATAGDKALVELQRILARFGCAQFGTATDAEKGETIVHFKWRERQVALHASWKGYAQAWLKEHPYHYSRTRTTRQEHEAKALTQAQTSVCSVLRDWVKGQITAVECGVLSFEAAFMPHMLLQDGRRVLDAAQALLPAPGAKVVDIKKLENGNG
jgi:hypothetical protein